MMMNTILICESKTFETLLVKKLSLLGINIVDLDKTDKSLNPSEWVLLIDIDSIKMSYHELSEIIHMYNCNAIAMTSLPRFDQCVHLMKMGIQGYMNTHSSLLNLNSAIQSIQNGGMWFDPGIVQDIIGNLSVSDTLEAQNEIDRLSEREIQIAHYVSKSLSNRQIAEQLEISERTVKAHLLACYHKLDLHDRVALALWGKRNLRA